MKTPDLSLIYLLEEISTNAWPPRTVQHLDGWRLQHTGGASRRVNSVWPNLQLRNLPLDEKLSLVEDFYHRRGLPPRFKLCPAAQPPDLWELLQARGYLATAPTQVQTASLDAVLAATEASSSPVRLSATLPDDWFDFYTAVEHFDVEKAAIRRGILTRIGPPAAFALFEMDGQPAGIGLGVFERGWVGVFCMVTHPDFRRLGVATAVLHALASWGAQRSASQLYLQVMDDNPPALALYRKLAFQPLYPYFYAEKGLRNP